MIQNSTQVENGKVEFGMDMPGDRLIQSTLPYSDSLSIPSSSELSWRQELQSFPAPDAIRTPQNQVQWIAREAGCYLLFRLLLRRHEEYQEAKNIWLAVQEQRRQREAEALTAKVHLPWSHALRNVDQELKGVLDLLLALEIHPSCLELFSGYFPDKGDSDISMGKLIQICCPYIYPDAVQLYSALDRLQKQSEVGFYMTQHSIFSRNTGLSSREVKLSKSTIREALGLSSWVWLSDEFVQKEYPRVEMDRVVLPQSMKEELLRLCRQVFDASGDSSAIRSMGLLFHGPSGTGKTMMAKALATTIGKPLITFIKEAVQASDYCYEEALVGLFARAEEEGAIVFIDEADDIFQEGSDASRALLLHLENVKGLVILATNRIQEMDPAVERRFTAKYRFKFPCWQERVLLWKKFLPDGFQYSNPEAPEILAKQYPLSGAQIEKCLNLASALTPESPESIRQLSADILRRCAVEQYSTFISEGLITDEGFPSLENILQPCRPTLMQDAEENARWVRTYRDHSTRIQEFFPDRVENGGIVMLIQGETLETLRDYARALSISLGYRLLRAQASDLLDLRQEKVEKYLPFVEYNPYDYYLTRLVDSETVLLLEDDQGTLHAATPENGTKGAETGSLLAAIQRSPALVIIATTSLSRLTESTAGWIDRIFKLTPASNAEKDAWKALQQQGYPLVKEESAQRFQESSPGKRWFRIAAMEAYLKAVAAGRNQITSAEIQALIRRYQEYQGEKSQPIFGSRD